VPSGSFVEKLPATAVVGGTLRRASGIRLQEKSETDRRKKKGNVRNASSSGAAGQLHPSNPRDLVAVIS